MSRWSRGQASATVNQEVRVPFPSMVSASPSSQKGWAQAQASYFWEQIHKEVGGELETKCSQRRGCCSSRSPLAEGRALWEGASG